MTEIRRCPCGKGFYPSSGGQRFCGRACPARRSSKRRPQSLRRAPLVDLPARECERCGRVYEPAAEHQRFCSDRCRFMARRRSPAKYGQTHRRLRRAWQRRIDSGVVVRCARGGACSFAELVDGVLVGGRIVPGMRWDLGHRDGGGPLDYAGPEHAKCNRGASWFQRKRPDDRQTSPAEDDEPGRIW
jgi:hypothetical protein